MTSTDLITATIPVFAHKPFRASAIAGIIRAKGNKMSDAQTEQILRGLVKQGQLSKGQFKGYYQA